MAFPFTLPERPAVEIEGGGFFPVRRIFCVGRNYAAHAREMGRDPDREPPFFFTKWADDLVPGGGDIPYPPETNDYQYEAELVVAIGREGAAVTAAKALELVFGYAVGLDMTRRDLQFQARDKGRPWDSSKNFAFSAPIGAIRPVEGHGHLTEGSICLKVNGATRQAGDVADMIWSCAETIAHMSRFERLLSGDLIYTGTPAGVGPVKSGDVLDVVIDGLQPLRVTIVEREAVFTA